MAVKKETKKKKILVSNGEGQVHIQCSANNTIITLTDGNGNALKQCSAGARGNRGAKKTTPFAAQDAVEACLADVAKFGITKVAIFVKGAGTTDIRIRNGISRNSPTATTLSSVQTAARYLMLHGAARMTAQTFSSVSTTATTHSSGSSAR